MSRDSGAQSGLRRSGRRGGRIAVRRGAACCPRGLPPPDPRLRTPKDHSLARRIGGATRPPCPPAASQALHARAAAFSCAAAGREKHAHAGDVFPACFLFLGGTARRGGPLPPRGACRRGSGATLAPVRSLASRLRSRRASLLGSLGPPLVLSLGGAARYWALRGAYAASLPLRPSLARALYCATRLRFLLRRSACLAGARDGGPAASEASASGAPPASVRGAAPLSPRPLRVLAGPPTARVPLASRLRILPPPPSHLRCRTAARFRIATPSGRR